MGKKLQPNGSKSSAPVTDDGRALLSGWHVAYTRVNYERRAANYIGSLGFETYVASQKEWHQWSDRRKLVDRIVIPLIVFVRCGQKDVASIERLSFVSHFLRVPGSPSLAVVPAEQIERLRFMLANADTAVTFSSKDFCKGDAVRIRFGKLCGLTGRVVACDDKSAKVVITLDYLGCASVRIAAEDLQPLRNQ